MKRVSFREAYQKGAKVTHIPKSEKRYLLFRIIHLHPSSAPSRSWRAKVLAIGKRWLGSNCLAVRDVDAFFMWHKVALYQMTRIFLGARSASLTSHEIARKSKIGNSVPLDWKSPIKTAIRDANSYDFVSLTFSSLNDGIIFIVKRSNFDFYIGVNISNNITILFA